MINKKFSMKVFLKLKAIKPAVLILMLLLVVQSIRGQNQVNMTDHLSQRFLEYCKSVPREEIFIHSDREEYISGEDFWFNIYLIDRQSFKPSQNSRVVYFELLNSENRPVIQRRILMDKGIGPGQIVLPDTLSTGLYTIRAYTSWMKNFLPYNCFIKYISVYNTLNNRGLTGVLYSGKGANKIIAPVKKAKGLILNVNNTKQNILEISLDTDSKYRSDNNNLTYIFVQTHGNINYVSSEKLITDTTIIMIPKTSLSDGINQITVFDAKGKPVGERYIYTPSDEKDFPAFHSSDSYGPRNKVTLELETGKDVAQSFNSTTMSVSVAPEENGGTIMDMKDYLVFGTEYGDAVWNLTNGRKINEYSHATMDSILLNVKSNWINWTDIVTGDLPDFKYSVEKEDHILSGKLLKSDLQPVHSGELIVMCAPGKAAAFQYDRTDEEGNFSFDIHIDEDLKDLIIMPDTSGKDQKIVIESSFYDQYFKPYSLSDSSAIPIPSRISKLSVNNQVQKIYGNSSSGDPVTSVSQSLQPVRFYGKPDLEIVLSDYISLPVMSEIFFELLPDVSLKKKKTGFEISIAYRIDDYLFTTVPCLMIDGVIIEDPGMIANIEPELVEQIDVIKGKYLVGKYIFPGLVNVITRAADFTCVPLPDYMMRLHYRVIDPVRTFVTPDYSTPEIIESRIPDYRNTLYWSPSVKPDQDGKVRIEFWSSDNKSNYVINIQGITAEGNIFSIRKAIEVKD